MIKKLILLSLVICFASCNSSSKPGPTDEQFKACYKTLISYSTLNRQGKFTAEEETKLKAFLQEEKKKYNLEKISYKQMISLSRASSLDAVNEWLMPVLKAKANQKSDSAWMAEYTLYTREGKNALLTFDRYMKIVACPSVLLPSDNSNNVLKLFNKVEMTDAQTIQFIEHILPHINSNAQIYAFYSLTKDIWNKILDMGDSFPKELKEQYYETVLNALDGIIKENKDLNINIAISTYDSFNTLFARRELIGSEAPEINFIWNSAGMKLKDLKDLRGKVVVLDFWATWCGPCVASFPNVRKLQERYKGYPVVILGVTSIQGRHIDRSGLKSITINTKGDPEKELNLMKQFMRDLNMTWTVAFAEQKVYNPDYGVLGVPHIAILDPEGKVRYNGLNPNTAPYEEAEKIDALLKEAGLKYPAEPMEKRNYAKEAREKK